MSSVLLILAKKNETLFVIHGFHDLISIIEESASIHHFLHGDINDFEKRVVLEKLVKSYQPETFVDQFKRNGQYRCLHL